MSTATLIRMAMDVLAMMFLPLDDPFPLYASALNYAQNLVVVKQNIEKIQQFLGT